MTTLGAQFRFPLTSPALFGAGLIALLGYAAPAMSQAPTKAQQSAIRSACADDYRSTCASVPPGGQAALTCLQQNAAKLSAPCRSAVQAVGGNTASAPADAAPAQAAGKEGTENSAAPSAPAQTSAIIAPTPRQELVLLRQSCARDVRINCQGVPVGGGNIVACLKENAASLSRRCKSALVPFSR
jgi:hypothetical protein